VILKTFLLWEKKLRGNLISDCDDQDDNEEDGQPDIDYSFEETTSDQEPCDA
jgi:hypothetical protein